MNILAVSSILVFLTNFIIGILVLWKGEDKKVKRSWFIFCMSICIWGIGSYIVFTAAKDKAKAYLGWQIANVGMLSVPIAYYYFIHTYCDLKRKYHRHILIVTNTLVFVVLILGTIYPKWTYGDLRLVFNQCYYQDWFSYKNSLYLICYISLYWVLLSYAFLILLCTYKLSKGTFRNQLKYLIIASIIGWLGPTFLWLIQFRIDIYPYSNFLIALHPIIIAYAILRHHLLDINIVIKKTAVYSILVTLITIIYFILIYISEFLFRGLVGYKSIPLAIGFIVLFSLIFQPLKNLIQSFLDRYFFKGSQAVLADELKKAREELKRTERLKAVGTLAAGMAHEIKNPLTGIKTFTEYLPAKYQDPAFIEKFHRIVTGEVNKINTIVQQLLDFSKPKPLNLKPSDIHETIEQTLTLLNNDLIKYKIKVTKNYDNTLSLLRIDPQQMQQVFLNLFLNAIDAMKEGGTLTVTTKAQSPKILQPLGLQDEQSILQKNPPTTQITIADTGKGISKKDLEHIFDPFYTTKETGTGLGMSIIYGIIKEHKGEISVESIVGVGTEFRIKLSANT